MSFFENTRKPVGFGGKIMVAMMNFGHSAMAEWGLRFLKPAPDAMVLDCGCGGGANIKTLLKLCPNGKVQGIDYSAVSVEKTRKVNARAIAAGRCTVQQASVAELPFEAEQFDVVTAFETVYFWPELAQNFREVYRVLKPGGVFFICNEANGETTKDDKWTQIIDGMAIYTDTALKEYLEQAGFCKIQNHKNKKGWLCITAQKLGAIMSKKATEFQRKAMSWMYRGKEIFKPLNTGWIDENVACVREWVANIFFYRKGDTTIMIDAGYNYDRLAEKMGWLGIDPKSMHHILITHQDTDHVGAVEADSPGLFRNAKLYIGEIENRYLTGEERRKVIYHLYKLPQVTINNEKVLLHDGQVLDIDGVRIECFLVPGHTWGHMVYLIDDKYIFIGDTLWFGADGGYSFISALAEDNKLAVKSLTLLEKKLKKRGLHPLFITGHTGWTDNMEFAFAHKNELCSPFKKKVHDPSAPYDAYDESDDTEENAKSGFLKGVGR